jgi:hypothetical protein
MFCSKFDNLLKCFLNLKGFNINILSFSDLNYVKTYYRKYPKTTPWRYDPNWVITPWRLVIEFEDKSNIFAMAEILDFL